MFKTLKAVGKRGKDALSSGSSTSSSSASSSSSSKKTVSRKGSKAELVIGGPVLVNDFSDRQLTQSAPARPMTKVDIHELVRKNNLPEMKKHRFTSEEINLRNMFGHTPLHVACSIDRGNVEVVGYLISLGADVNATDLDGWTPLHAACKHDESGNLIPLLVSHGADVNIPNKDGTRPLHYFARKCLQTDTLEPNARALDIMLTAGAEINATNMNGETALHSCVMNGNLATLELFINRNADISVVNKLGDNVLHYAVMRQRLDVIHKLLRMGIDPTVSTPGGVNGSPLDVAKKETSQAGKEISELLTRPAIEEEEEENTDNTDRKTDLWSLTKAGDWNEIKKWREKNPVTDEDLRGRNASGQCLLHLACNQAEPNREIIDYLITGNPGDINWLDNDGCSPLHYACKKNNDGETIAVLVAKGADVSRSSNDGTKPIHYFARRSLLPETIESNSKALEFLLTYGADINAPNKYGESPLHNAIMQGNFLMLQLLLTKNPDLYFTNNYGENILHYAIISQKKDMVDKILDLGIDPRVGPATNGTPLQSAKLLSGQPKGKEVYDIVQRKATALDIAGMNDEEKREYRRKRVIDELVETEREYSSDLGIIIKVYVNPLKAFVNTEEAFLTEWQMEDIFGNIEEIKVVSDDMNRSLQICQMADPQYFGQVFLTHMEDLQKYEEVCVHQQIATDALQDALNSQKSFRAFCEAAQKHRDCKKLSIDALLIKPFQRITKYPLLLRELVGVTPEDHPDYPDVVKAREKLEVLINVANEKKRVIDNKMLIKRINYNLVYRDDDERLDLTADENRIYKREGLFKMSFNKEKMFKRTVFLFHDLILLCQAEKKKYGFLHYIPLSQCIVWDVTDGSLEGGKPVKNAFSVIHRVKQLRVVICTDSTETKKEWMHAMNECISAGPAMAPVLKSRGTSTTNLRGTQTLPQAFKGFGLKRGNTVSVSDENHNHTNGSDGGVASDSRSSSSSSPSSSFHPSSHSTYSLASSPLGGHSDGGSSRSPSSPHNNAAAATDSKKKRSGGTLLISSPTGQSPSPPSLSPTSYVISPPLGSPTANERRHAGGKAASDDSSASSLGGGGGGNSSGGGGGLLGVLRRKTSTGERFRASVMAHTNNNNNNTSSDSTSASPSPSSSFLSPGVSRVNTSPYAPAEPVTMRPRTTSAVSASHAVNFSSSSSSPSSSSVSPSPATTSFPAVSTRFAAESPPVLTSSPSAPGSSPGSSPSNVPRRRVRALSSYNTAPNRPLPSTPGVSGGTFAAAATLSSSSSSSSSHSSPTHSPPPVATSSSSSPSPSPSSSSPSVPRAASGGSGVSFNVSQTPQQPLAKALFDFVGDKAAFQINLKEGDVITVFERDDEKGDGWWYGECNKVTGYFPGHYVELL